MIQYNESIEKKFDISSAYVTIAAAAILFRSRGREHIWIYLKDGELKFFPVKFDTLSSFFVAHYRCSVLLYGFTNRTWRELGRRLSRVYFEHRN